MKPTKQFLNVLFSCLLLCFTYGATGTHAATFTVTNTDDSGTGSLRQAISDANNAASDDTIVFDTSVFNSIPQTIILTSAQLLISNNGSLTINGTGANVLTVSGNNSRRVFSIAVNATAIINGLTITNGSSSSIGAGVLNQGVLSMDAVVVTNNTANFFGSGISSNGGSSILNLTNSTISNNTVNSNNSGSGIYNEGTINISNSTISGNRALGTNGNNGGGIWTNNTANITNSTITDNEAGGANSAGGLYSSSTGGAVTVTNTIIAANRSNSTTPDIFVNSGAAITSQGYNLIGNPGNASLAATGDQAGNAAAPLDPLLAPLMRRGGTTPTHGFASLSSPALDQGNSFGATTDQRGGVRPFDNPTVLNAAGGDGSDIGAFEEQTTTAARVAIGGRVISNRRGVANAIVSLTNSAGKTSQARTNSFGYFRFAEVSTGETVVISVRAKRYTFQPQIFSVTNETLSILLVAN